VVALVKFNLHYSGVGEEGQFGFYCTPGGATSQSDMENVAGHFMDYFVNETWGSNLRSFIGTDQAFDYCTVYYYPDAAANAAYGAQQACTHAQGVGTGNTQMSLQQAACVTLLTGHSGASYRGRIYLPATAVILSTSHQFSGGLADEFRITVAGEPDPSGCLLDAAARSLDQEGDGGAAPVVYSRKLNSANEITSVKVDTLPDTQRRRAESATPVAVSTGDFYFFTG